MAYFGLGISCFVFFTVIVLFFMYIINAIFCHYSFANSILPLLFLHMLFSILILVWSLIVMHGGFSVDFNIKIDFTMIFIFFIIVMLFMEWLDWKVRKGLCNLEKKKVKAYRYFLPTGTIILFFFVTLIFYFICHSFFNLITW